MFDVEGPGVEAAVDLVVDGVELGFKVHFDRTWGATFVSITVKYVCSSQKGTKNLLYTSCKNFTHGPST